jgi:hypothetical protein
VAIAIWPVETDRQHFKRANRGRESGRLGERDPTGGKRTGAAGGLKRRAEARIQAATERKKRRPTRERTLLPPALAEGGEGLVLALLNAASRERRLRTKL